MFEFSTCWISHFYFPFLYFFPFFLFFFQQQQQYGRELEAGGKEAGSGSFLEVRKKRLK